MAAVETSRRSYGQYCAIAHALDLVGERWTLLVVRELLLGPLRYTDLLEGLPGIATNLLARRLHDLEDLGIVERRVLSRPASSTVYALTKVGESLEPTIIALGRFGGRFLPEQLEEGQVFRPRQAVTGLKHTFRPSRAESVRRSYELDIEGEVYHLDVDGDRLVARQGEAPAPHVAIRVSASFLLELLSRSISPEAALESGRVAVEIRSATSPVPTLRSARDELELFVNLFGWRPRAAATSTT